VYKQILIPLDGSTFAESALPMALALSGKTKAAVHLVSVVEPIPAFAYEEWEAAAREWSEEYLENVAKRVRDEAGGEVTTGLRSGHVVETVLNEASSRHADLIVMATHGRGALSRAWLGSVADAVMRQAKVPVLFVRPGDGEAPSTLEPKRLETVLIPLDGSDLSELALEHATELGELFGSAYHLTRVVAYPLDIASPYLPYTVQMNQSILTEAKETAAHYLEERAESMRRRGLRVTTSVAVDAQAGHGILSEADEVGCDLIAMATHGRTGVGRLVLGSAADKVLRGTHVPLLLFRPAKVPAVKV
jgi:nucleotide-binding universal stress UspA family protein